MTVARVLASKNVDGVHTIAPDATIADAVAELASLRIGALVVSSDERAPEGILSERDIVRAMGREGGTLLGRKVSELMTSPVETVSPDDAANDVLKRMTAGRFRHMPVIRDGALVGLISIGDVVKMRLSEVQSERDAMEAMIAGYA
jgi:CBS domain-containing protein